MPKVAGAPYEGNAGTAPVLSVSGGDGPIANLEMAMAWLILVTAGLFEIGWAVGLKFADGFNRLWPSVGTVVAMAASVILLGLALRSLPLGTAYAIWTGIGTIGTAVCGIILFQESADPLRLICIGMIAAGIVGLKLVTP